MKNVGIIDTNKDYIRVDIKHPIHSIDFADMANWLHEYPGKGSYALGGWAIFFENEDDAMMCRLRWTGDTIK